MRRFAKLRTDAEVCLRIARESLERASLRILARRYGKSKNTVMAIVRRVFSALPDSAAIARKFAPRWSGVLVVDGKVVRVYDELATKLDRSRFSDDELRWMHKARWLCGVDYGTGDLPHYALAETESRVDLVMYFEALRSLRYPLRGLICDGNPEIPRAARFVFGNTLVVQRCTRHFLEDLRRLLPADERGRALRARLEAFISAVKRVIEAPTLDSALAHAVVIDEWRRTHRSPLGDRMYRMFQTTKEELLAHLLHPDLDLPHTSNDAESLFKQLNLRLRSLGRFYRFRFARDYLNAWALLRRFTTFTDCCKSRSHRNGKAPIELAGAAIVNIDPLKLRN